MSVVRYDASWFQGDHVCRVGHDLAIVLVKGCASGFVKRVAHYQRHGSWVRHSREIHALIGRDPNGSGLATLAERTPTEHVVALWRDPVDRFAAVFGEWCIERVPHLYPTYASLQVDADWHRFLRFAEFELGKGDPAAMVEHLRPQAASWTSDQVDEVVPAAQVRRVLRRYGVRYRRFVAPVRRRVPKPPPEVAARVQELYAADYGLRP